MIILIYMYVFYILHLYIYFDQFSDILPKGQFQDTKNRPMCMKYVIVLLYRCRGGWGNMQGSYEMAHVSLCLLL